MIVVTIFCVIPLGLLRNVDSLSTVCTASIGFYFCLVTKVGVLQYTLYLYSNDDLLRRGSMFLLSLSPFGALN